MDFVADRLADWRQPFADTGPAAIVAEGDLRYLDEARIRDLLRTLRTAFPRAEVRCDAITADFINRHSRAIQGKISDPGASFAPPEHSVDAIFAGEGCRETAQTSNAGHPTALRHMPWHRRLFAWVPRALAYGYTLRVFTLC